jgi:hypothetical protein
MVQIKLSVAFILASAAIAPVVALPFPAGAQPPSIDKTSGSVTIPKSDVTAKSNVTPKSDVTSQKLTKSSVTSPESSVHFKKSGHRKGAKRAKRLDTQPEMSNKPTDTSGDAAKPLDNKSGSATSSLVPRSDSDLFERSPDHHHPQDQGGNQHGEPHHPHHHSQDQSGKHHGQKVPGGDVASGPIHQLENQDPAAAAPPLAPRSDYELFERSPDDLDTPTTPVKKPHGHGHHGHHHGHGRRHHHHEASVDAQDPAAAAAPLTPRSDSELFERSPQFTLPEVPEVPKEEAKANGTKKVKVKAKANGTEKSNGTVKKGTKKSNGTEKSNTVKEKKVQGNVRSKESNAASPVSPPSGQNPAPASAAAAADPSLMSRSDPEIFERWFDDEYEFEARGYDLD